MSGLIPVAVHCALVPDVTLGEETRRFLLSATQAIVEGVTGLVFGSEVRSVTVDGSIYRITYDGGLYQPGDSIALIGGGLNAEVFEITAVGMDDLDHWLEISSDDALAPARLFPVVVQQGTPNGRFFDCRPCPVFRVITVQAKTPDQLWSESQTIETTEWELTRKRNLSVGVEVQLHAIPKAMEGGRHLIKRRLYEPLDCFQVTYVAGIYSVPQDLMTAAIEIASMVRDANESGGVYASESLDYYSYTRIGKDQLSMVPHSAMAVLRRYKL